MHSDPLETRAALVSALVYILKLAVLVSSGFYFYTTIGHKLLYLSRGCSNYPDGVKVNQERFPPNHSLMFFRIAISFLCHSLLEMMVSEMITAGITGLYVQE